MPCLDPTLDLVFKLLLTRQPALLRDMLEGILARPIPTLRILDPDVPGEQVLDRRVIFDVRAVLHDGSHVDVEMQRRISTILRSREVYYTARNYSDQLNRGDEYHLLTPATGILWLGESLFPALPRLHSIFELRERHTHTRWGDQLSIHLLQLPHRSSSSTSRGYTASVERWARFLTARTDAQRHALAREHPIMTLAKQTLDTLSQDPRTRRRARHREDQLRFYELEQIASRLEARAEGEALGRAEGEALGRAQGEHEGKVELLLMQLGLRFGPPDAATRARVEAASAPQLDRWAERMLTAPTLDAVLAP
ncbi:MAG: Rpn family recombination-promoting nuclease/putative transposase [Myxococcales bacterium]|nr:Rpn family recombination-promoting nuclease/putative transposase [Myxococcales bacterium]